MTGYFADLERELVAAAERQRDAASPSPRPARRRRRVAAVTVGLIAVAGVPAAAVTGVFRPHDEADGLGRLSARRVIAEGDTPDRGHWKLTASRSDVGFCFGIDLPTLYFAGDEGRTQSEGCGGAEPGTLSVATSSGGSVPHNGLAFGTAPRGADRVRVVARAVSVTVEAIDDDAGLPGRFYVAELPVRRSLGAVTVTALDAEDKPIATVNIGRAG